MYAVRVEARTGRGGKGDGELLSSEASYVRVAEPQDEYFGGAMRPSLLKRIAEETGGRFYTPQTVKSLPEDMRFTEGGATTIERKDLWDMPIVFLLLVGLVAGEWAYRRSKGLA